MADRHGPNRLFDWGFGIVLAMALAAGTAVWVTKGRNVFLEILWTDLTFVAVLLPKIAGGILVASFLPVFLPRERILALVGPESGIRGLAIATTAGAIIPGGPATTMPLAVGLMAAGADFGAGLALVLGWMLLGVNRVLIWELSFLPTDLVLLRVLLSLPAPILIGLAARWLIRSGRMR